MEPYKLSRLFDAGGDLNERWFVFYYFINPDTGKYRRFKDYIPAPIITASGRRDRAYDMMRAIDKKLKQGFNPFTSKEKRFTSIKKALEFALDIKKCTTRKRTYYTYRYVVNSLLRWLKKKGRDNMPVDHFSRYMAQEFTDYSLTDLGLSRITVNYRTMHLKGMFNLLIKREYISVNPFQTIEKLPVDEANINRFLVPELQKMEDYLPVWNYDLYVIACLVFYCFIRPQEIVRMRVENIDLANRIINIPGSMSKNRKTEMVQIPDAMIPVMRKLDLDFPGTFFVFSKDLRRGEKEIAPTRIAAAWREFADHVGIDKVIYDLKHTGAGMAIEAGINARDLQLQLRHSSLDMTQRYLDKFRRRPSEKLAKDFPDLSRLTKNTLPSRSPLPPHIYNPGLS